MTTTTTTTTTTTIVPERDALLLDLLLGAGVIGILLMGFDKLAAIGGNRRVSERSLWLIALVGGFWGIALGAYLFHHKTSKSSFWPPVFIAAVMWVPLLLYFLPHLSLPSALGIVYLKPRGGTAEGRPAIDPENAAQRPDTRRGLGLPPPAAGHELGRPGPRPG